MLVTYQLERPMRKSSPEKKNNYNFKMKKIKADR